MFDNISLIMKQDAAYIKHLEDENKLMREIALLITAYIKDVEIVNRKYWNMINAHNRGTRRTIRLLKMNSEREKKRFYRCKMTARDKTIYDGDERYAQHTPREKIEEVIL